MLQGGAELQLETVVIARQTADIMQRVVAETVQLVEFALVHRVCPVNLEELLRYRCDTVHIVGVEGDDARPEDVSDVAERGVFIPFKRQLVRQTRLRLDTRLDCRHNESVSLQSLPQDAGHLHLHLFKHRNRRTILLQNDFRMQIHSKLKIES